MSLNLERVVERLSTQAIARRLIYLTSTTSTQDIARREAEDGAVHGTAVIAEEQTAGRGRLGRSWVSPAGKNIYVTLLLRPELARLRVLGMTAPLAVVRAVESVTGLAPTLKWPNDVLLSGRKLAGVLIDSELSGSAVKYALLGIGVNVNFDIPERSEIAPIATSLKREVGSEVSREDVFAALLNAFEQLYLHTPAEAIRDAWRERLQTLGREVTVTFRGAVHEGVAEDIGADGSLLLRRADGSQLVVEAGEVTLRAP
jgi:BirA family biotin operon repressor/biotin-[acetyl-CoA-carboxylase] ligase